MTRSPWRLCCLFFLFAPALFAQDSGGKVAPLPPVFDLRKVDGVTPVKQQQGGTCWTHGAMAAIESNMLVSGRWKKFMGDGLPAFSEYHLDWWNGFNKHKNDDLEDAAKDPSGLKPHVGGDYRVTAAYIARGDGVVAIHKTMDLGRSWYTKPPERNDPEYPRFYVRNIEWFTIGDELQNIDILKARIMKEGAVGTAYAVGKAFISKDFVHYQPLESKTQPNHAVAIVGWDDAKVPEGDKKVPKPGAWLIKNSWGTKKGAEGYYWISYYDKCCCRHPEMGAVSFRNIEPLKYTHIYQHDYHGWRDTLKDVNKAFNAFTATGDQTIHAVSFYTAADNVDVVVKIYGTFDKTQLLDERRVLKDSIRHAGLHTLDLDRPLDIKKGERFYVQVVVSAGGQAIDRTSEIPVLLEQVKLPPGRGPNGPIVISKANPGESYFWTGTAWKDLYEHTFENPVWATFDRSANFCMKALAAK